MATWQAPHDLNSAVLHPVDVGRLTSAARVHPDIVIRPHTRPAAAAWSLRTPAVSAVAAAHALQPVSVDAEDRVHLRVTLTATTCSLAVEAPLDWPLLAAAHAIVEHHHAEPRPSDPPPSSTVTDADAITVTHHGLILLRNAPFGTPPPAQWRTHATLATLLADAIGVTLTDVATPFDIDQYVWLAVEAWANDPTLVTVAAALDKPDRTA